MKLHVLTAVSRPVNMGRVGESLAVAAALAPSLDVHWHWRFDIARQHVGGQALKNAMLDDVSDGFIWVLDDDTLVPEELLRNVSHHLKDSRCAAVVVSQLRTTGRVLPADPNHVRPGGIDVGQAFVRRDIIGDHRIPEEYDGDGWWLSALLVGQRVIFRPEIVALHNAISGVDVSA